MRRIFLGFVAGVILVGVIGGYFIGPQYFGLMSRVDRIEESLKTNEFYLEILFYQVWGFPPSPSYGDLFLPGAKPGQLAISYEMYLNNSEIYRDNNYRNISIIRVSKEQLREHVDYARMHTTMTTGNEKPPFYSGLFTFQKHETLCIWKYHTFPTQPGLVEVLWWSPRSELPWPE